jgi:hypothetical protein
MPRPWPCPCKGWTNNSRHACFKARVYGHENESFRKAWVMTNASEGYSLYLACEDCLKTLPTELQRKMERGETMCYSLGQGDVCTIL